MADRDHLAVAHLLLRLKPINRLLRRAAARVSRQPAPTGGYTAHALSLQEIDWQLDDVEALPVWTSGSGALEPPELTREAELRELATQALPLDALRDHLGLGDFEMEALLLCAAPELESRYERIYGYILDDLGRGEPCVELVCSLSARTATERHARRSLLAPEGRLVRLGLLRLGVQSASEWRREIRLTPKALSFLLGSGGAAEDFRDWDEVMLAADVPAPWGVDESDLRRAAETLAGPVPAAVSVFGGRESSQAELPGLLARWARRPLRRTAWDAEPAAIASDAAVASRLGAILWLAADGVDATRAVDDRTLATLDRLAPSGPHLVLSGPRPIRALGVMAARPWLELSAEVPSLREVEARWATELPEVAPAIRADIARCYRLAPGEVRAAANLFRHAAAFGEPRARLERACRTVARRHTERFASVVVPARQPDDLVLPAAVHARVLDVAHFARAWPDVAERWGLGRLHNGRGIRALFTGPPGTGKTLAAEVVAGMLGQELHKVDLAALTSKWVGETEKNLDVAFREAEQSQAVLFFDEADALFSKRGEVKHGMDRYANLEVSYLLQRLEEYAGTVILASNLRENLDDAFSRRFHVVVDFPRPAESERRRLWARAFPPEVPRDNFDVNALAALDMTGATIVNAARTAILLAATNGQVVRPAHVIEGISREFLRENRILLPEEVAGVGAGAVT